MSNFEMIRDELRKLKHELASTYHIGSMGLFGSVVRDDFTPNSDIDIIVDFTEPIGIGFIELADILENRLKKPVDLVSRRGIKEKQYKLIEHEIVYV